MAFINFTPPNKLVEVEREVAIAIAKVAYFISPNVVRRVAELNKKWQAEFQTNYGLKIDAEHFFYDGSACLFPGIRRPAEDAERILGKGRGKRKYHSSVRAILDDNVFPRHLWCFLCAGKQYTGPTWRDSGLGEFELAHILPHKKYELDGVKNWFAKAPHLLHGLFSCAANVILLPKGMAKPTDGTEGIRFAVLKRYFDLYGDNHSGGFGGLNLPERLNWYDELKWNEPIEPKDWESRIEKLDNFRKEKIRRLLKD